MKVIAIYRFSTLCLAGAAMIVSLGSCAKSVTTEGDTTSRQGVSLKDMGNGICRLPSGLMWQIQKSQKFSTWDEADNYVSSLGLGGFDDWRLPSREESLDLAEILEIKKGACAIKFKSSHWVSNSNNKNPLPGYWEDYPLCGGSDFRWVKGKRGRVRAVRP